MRKYLPLLALPALAALLQACTSAPISHHAGQGRCQGTGGAAAPAAEGSRGAGAATAAAAWLQSDLSLLTILSDENFTGALADTEHALVIFYAPYSGHCKRARHALAAAVPDIRGRHPHVLLAQFDAYGPGQDHNTTFGKRYAPHGFPMVCWFVNSTLADDRIYSRSREGLIAYVDEQLKRTDTGLVGSGHSAAPAQGSSDGNASPVAGERQEL